MKPAGSTEALSDTWLCVVPRQVCRDGPPGRDADDMGAVASPLHGADSALGTPPRGPGLPPPLRLLRPQRSPLHVPLLGLCARWDLSTCGKNQSGVCTTFLLSHLSLLASGRAGGWVSSFVYGCVSTYVTASVHSSVGHRALHDVGLIKRTCITLLNVVLWGPVSELINQHKSLSESL